MEIFTDFLARIENNEHRQRTKEVLSWINQTFPQLNPRIAWNQPIFTDHGTFIIGLSVSKKHLAISPEKAGIAPFSTKIIQAGYHHTKMLVHFPWDKPIDYQLIAEMIRFNLVDKANCDSFWRKQTRE